MRVMILAGWLVASLAAIADPAAAQGIPRNLPRNETLILENPEGTIKNAGWFNIWAINAGSQSNGLQQAALDTLWYIDPESRHRRRLGQFARRRQADLQRRLHRDDGEAAPRASTGATASSSPPPTWSHTVDDADQESAACAGARCSAINVDSMETPDPYTVVFKLKKPNSRFHALFTVRWNAIWIMPKHVFEKVEDPQKFDFNKPVSLGAYVLNSYDPDGKWYIWQLRDDWQRTTLGRFGKPGPKYLAYVDPGPPDKRVIAQLNHELDVIHDVAPEGMFTLAKQSKIVARLVQELPLRAPRPDAAGADLQHAERAVQEPRRALGAGAAHRHQGRRRWRPIAAPRRSRRSACRRPARIPETYHAPMEEWLKDVRDRHRQAQDQAVRPDRRQADRRHAAALDGRADPDRPEGDRQVLRHAAGGSPIRRPRRSCSRRPATPSAATPGSRRTASRSPSASWSRANLRPVMTRAGSMIVQQWRQFGIDAKIDIAQGTLADAPRRRRFRHADQLERRDLGRPPGPRPTSSTAGTRSSSRRPASRSRRATGSAGRSPELDKIIEQIRSDRLRRSEGDRARPRVRQARRPRDADHPADGLQRLHGDG